MKLYYTNGVCSLAVRIILNETNSLFEAEAVDLKTKQTALDKNFLEINPKGAVPTLELDNGEILTEVAVILQYIAEKNKATGLLPPSDDFRHYRVLELLNYVATEIHKGFGPLVNPAIDQNLKERVFIPILNRKLEYINSLLTNQQYLLGNDFTLPDAYLFVTLRWAKSFHVDLTKFPAITAYIANLSTRKSIAQSLKQES